MSERKKHHWLSSWFLEAEEGSGPIRYWLTVFLLVGAGVIVATASRSPWMADERARLDVDWRFERGDYSYRLRGRYSIASLSDDFVTSVSNDANPDATASFIDVPTGLYRITLEPGYTLERVLADGGDAARGTLVGDAVEIVPASLVSPNPVVVMAKEGRIAPLRLSLVDMPGTAADPEETCMTGS